MLNTKKKQTAIKKTQIHDTDTGSVPAQISIISTRIDELAKHLKTHKKDNHSRRGLLKMVADRRTHLKYLERKDKKAYDAVVKKLELK
jgi:small subunit ribosomal protein S15